MTSASVNSSTYYASTAAEAHSSVYSPVSICITPPFLVIGVIGNVLVLLVMPRSCVQTSATSRVYYCWIAFFDALTILSKDIVFSLFGMGITYVYNDYPPAFIEELYHSVLSCKIVSYIYSFAEMTANNTIVALAIERIIIMFLPFQAKQLTGKRKANIGLSFLLTFTMVISICFILANILALIPNFGRLPLCVAGNPNYLWASQVVISAYMLIYVVPTFCGTILATVALIKMKSILSKSRQLTRKADDDFGSKELKSTVVMIATVVVNNIIFIPIGLCYCVLIAVQTLDPTNAILQMKITFVWLYMYPFAILPHSCQIFIYCSQIPGFRQGVASLFKRK